MPNNVMFKEIYVDGSSFRNPGGPSAGAIVDASGQILDAFPLPKAVTSAQAELAIILEALRIYGPKGVKRIYSDSKYAVDARNLYLKNWKINGWKTAARKSVANRELIEEIDELATRFGVELRWIEGGSTTQQKLADLAARETSRKMATEDQQA